MPNSNQQSNVTDRRATIRAKGGAGKTGGWDDLFCPEDPTHVLYPLRQSFQGLVFPYTPDVMFNPQAMWDQQNFSHSNYGFNSWQYSDVGDITVTGDFTAYTSEEARYMVAVTHFLKGSMKGGFGRQDTQRGVPPGVYEFNYLGDYQFKRVPVVFTSAQFTYPKDVDYVPVDLPNPSGDTTRSGNTQTWVPMHMTVMIVLKPTYNVKSVRDKFSLEKFRRGDLLTGSNQDNTGGGFL